MRRISPSLVVCGWLGLVGAGCSGTGGAGGDAGIGGTPGSGGTISSGGASGAAGTAGAGGATGPGGMGGGTGGRGGGAGRGGGGTGTGGTGTAGMSGSGGSGMTVNCTFTATAATSAKIPTVGILTWSTSLVGVSAAHVDFGLTTSYGMTAPVDLAQPSYRTLLLGMKAARTYHYRITATAGVGACVSPDYTIMTGALANGLQRPTLTPATASAAGVYGGFLITGQYVMNAGAAGAPAYILDADGDYVWWFNINSDVTGARMSYDGTHMWINGANVPSGAAHVHRVTMDGMTDEDLSSQFAGLNHQLTVLPDETVAFYAYGSNGCEDIKERAPSGMVKTIVNARTAHGGTSACHVNSIHYSKADDTLVFSDLDNQDLTKITRTGATVWVLNGTGNTFTGVTWKGGQHGFHLLGLDDVIVFNNNSRVAAGSTTGLAGTGDGSSTLEIKLDATAKTATQVGSYKANPAVQNDVMGDVERLPNGNTIVAFSTKGTLHEVSSTGAVLQRWTWSAGASFGYIEKRATLYGPPPK